MYAFGALGLQQFKTAMMLNSFLRKIAYIQIRPYTPGRVYDRKGIQIPETSLTSSGNVDYDVTFCC